MTCRYCGLGVANWGERLRHEQGCEQNPENAAKVAVTFPCGHTEDRHPFEDDPDGAKLAAFALARRECSDCFIESYKRAQANLSPDAQAERAFEMRAAFGTGVEVVNVVTGETFLT